MAETNKPRKSPTKVVSKDKSTSTNTTMKKPTRPSQYCKFFNSEKGCDKGDECKFLHEKEPCRFYSKGKCNKGDECPFPHVDRLPKEETPCRFEQSGGCKRGAECHYKHSN